VHQDAGGQGHSAASRPELHAFAPRALNIPHD